MFRSGDCRVEESCEVLMGEQAEDEEEDAVFILVDTCAVFTAEWLGEKGRE
jgi:hypothetical protein